MKKRKCRCTHVYIIGFEDGPVKIGMSSDPRGRTSAVKNYAKAATAKLLWSQEHEQADSIEAAAHWYLMMYEAGQEWFFVSFQKAKLAVEKALKYYAKGKMREFYNTIMPLDQAVLDAAKQSYFNCNTWWLHFIGHNTKVKGFVPIYKEAKAKCLKDRKSRNQHHKFMLKIWGPSYVYKF